MLPFQLPSDDDALKSWITRAAVIGGFTILVTILYEFYSIYRELRVGGSIEEHPLVSPLLTVLLLCVFPASLWLKAQPVYHEKLAQLRSIIFSETAEVAQKPAETEDLENFNPSSASSKDLNFHEAAQQRGDYHRFFQELILGDLAAALQVARQRNQVTLVSTLNKEQLQTVQSYLSGLQADQMIRDMAFEKGMTARSVEKIRATVDQVAQIASKGQEQLQSAGDRQVDAYIAETARLFAPLSKEPELVSGGSSRPIFAAYSQKTANWVKNANARLERETTRGNAISQDVMRLYQNKQISRDAIERYKATTDETDARRSRVLSHISTVIRNHNWLQEEFEKKEASRELWDEVLGR